MGKINFVGCVVHYGEFQCKALITRYPMVKPDLLHDWSANVITRVQKFLLNVKKF